MAAPTLQDGIDRAGSPVALLWRPNAQPWLPEVIEPEYAGWRQEQGAWHSGVSISDLSHHMFDTFIEGPDAVRLLAAVSANNYEAFAINQAKQFVVHRVGFFFFRRAQRFGRAKMQMVFHQIPRHAAQRFLHRSDLHNDVRAVAIFGHHFLQSAHLPFNSPQAFVITLFQFGIDGQRRMPRPHHAGTSRGVRMNFALDGHR